LRNDEPVKELHQLLDALRDVMEEAKNELEKEGNVARRIALVQAAAERAGVKWPGHLTLQ